MGLSPTYIHPRLPRHVDGRIHSVPALSFASLFDVSLKEARVDSDSQNMCRVNTSFNNAYVLKLFKRENNRALTLTTSSCALGKSTVRTIYMIIDKHVTRVHHALD
jgi:hypothetical protein